MDMEELLDAQSASQFFAAPTIDGAAQTKSPLQCPGQLLAIQKSLHFALAMCAGCVACLCAG